MSLSCKIMAFCLGVSTILSRRRLSHPTRVWRRFFVPSTLRRNFSLVTRYSLKFTRCSLLVVKSLVTCCRSCSLRKITRYLLQNYSLLVAEVAINHSLLVRKFARQSLQKLLVAKIYSLLVAKFTLCKKITRYSLRNSLVTCCYKSLVTQCKESFITR